MFIARMYENVAEVSACSVHNDTPVNAVNQNETSAAKML
jgi:hypothetical protein